MTRFQYVQPRTLPAALSILKESGSRARLLAGGTDLLVRLRSGHVHPRVVVDLKRIDALDDGITRIDSALRIGGRCTMATLTADSSVREYFPALIEAARVVGSVQIRNRATLAGNMCNASPAADTAPALLVYGAVMHVAGDSGIRSVPLVEFFSGPGKTVLASDEIVTAIDLPLPDAPTGAAFTRLTRRRGVDLATLIVCSAVTKNGAVRVALGAVAATPLIATTTTHELGHVGNDRDQLVRAIARLAQHASPISDVRASRDYRAAMLPVFIERSLKLAVDRLQ